MLVSFLLFYEADVRSEYLVSRTFVIAVASTSIIASTILREKGSLKTRPLSTGHGWGRSSSTGRTSWAIYIFLTRNLHN